MSEQWGALGSDTKKKGGKTTRTPYRKKRTKNQKEDKQTTLYASMYIENSVCTGTTAVISKDDMRWEKTTGAHGVKEKSDKAMMEDGTKRHMKRI